MTQLSQDSMHVQYDPFAGPAILHTIPTSEAQREMWTAAQIGVEASCAYNEPLSIQFTGFLDIDALQKAMNDVVAEHEALRATVSPDGTILSINAPESVDLNVAHGVIQMTYDERDDFIDSVMNTPFDLEMGPLFQARLFALPDVDGQPCYELFICAHHIVCDGWSFGVIMQSLGAHYARYAGNPAPPLIQSIPYSEYVKNEKTIQATPQYATEEAYWLQQFADARTMPILELPLDRPRPAVRTYTAARVDHVLGKEQLLALKRWGAKSGVSLFTVLIAGWAATIHRLTGNSDMVIGVPFAGQPVAGLDTVVGHCVNTLPIRFKPEANKPFEVLLREAQKQVLDAFDHPRTTFGSLLKKLDLARDTSRSALVSILFNLDQSIDMNSLGFTGLDVELRSIPRAFENFEWSINAVERQGELILECQYNQGLFDHHSIERHIEEWATLIMAALNEPAKPIGDLPILPARQLALFAQWNQRQQPYPGDRSVVDLVHDQSRRTPDRIAVSDSTTSITYSQLMSKVAAVADELINSGVQPGQIIGVLLERNVDMMVAVLGVLHAGAAYMPLDPSFPVSRLATMIDDSGTSSCLVDGAFISLFDEVAGTLAKAPAKIILSDVTPLPVGANLAPRHQSQPEEPAYLLYTSGSTGKPKGVRVPHRAMVNLLYSVKHEPGFTERDRFLAITTLAFDIAVTEIYLPLLVGATTILAPRDIAKDPWTLLALLKKERINFLQATPAAFKMLLAAEWERDSTVEPLRIIVCGEALGSELAHDMVARAAEVWNMYGPTETTVFSTGGKVDYIRPNISAHIGPPVANTQIHILDENGQRTPIGVTGELHIGGDGVSLGYLNRPELNAERFVPDTFTGIPGAKLYRTGDLGYWLADGNIQYLSRNDFQIKVRGFRIEAGDIESVIRLMPGVQDCLVMLDSASGSEAVLVSYVKTADSAVTADGIITQVQRQLPPYMVPAKVILLKEWPLTPTGKIDRKALPKADQVISHVASQNEDDAPQTETEKILASLWCELLERERISVFDRFFDLGGHSFAAMQVITRFEKQTGLRIQPREMVMDTLAQIAERYPLGQQGNQQAVSTTQSANKGGLFSKMRRLFGSNN